MSSKLHDRPGPEVLFLSYQSTKPALPPFPAWLLHQVAPVRAPRASRARIEIRCGCYLSCRISSPRRRARQTRPICRSMRKGRRRTIHDPTTSAACVRMARSRPTYGRDQLGIHCSGVAIERSIQLLDKLVAFDHGGSGLDIPSQTTLRRYTFPPLSSSRQWGGSSQYTHTLV